jgi:hypothetical protein
MIDATKVVRFLRPYEEAVGVPLEVRREDCTVVFRDFIIMFSKTDFEMLDSGDIIGIRVAILKTDLPNRPIIIRILDSPTSSKSTHLVNSLTA